MELSGREPARLCTHWSCSPEPGSWEETGNRNLPCQLLKAIWDPSLRQAVSSTGSRDLILPASHTDCLGWHRRGGTTLWRSSANAVQDLPKGILGSEVSWSRQVTSHLQHWINRISHKLVQLPLNSSVLPTWQQPVLIYSCADSDTSPPFEAAQRMPGLSTAHFFSDFSRLPLL